MNLLFIKDGVIQFSPASDRRKTAERLLADGWIAYAIEFVGQQQTPVLKRQRIKPGSQQYVQVLAGVELEEGA